MSTRLSIVPLPMATHQVSPSYSEAVIPNSNDTETSAQVSAPAVTSSSTSLPDHLPMASRGVIASNGEAAVPSNINDLRYISTQVSAPAVASSFTCFPLLPAEIQDLIWEEALTGITVLRLDKRWRPGDPLDGALAHAAEAFNPLSIALSCKAAANRWRHLYPFTMVAAIPAGIYGLRLNLDWTVLYCNGCPSTILRFLATVAQHARQAQRRDAFHVRHFAYPDNWEDHMGRVQTGDDLLTRFRKRMNFPWGAIYGGILARRRQTETVIAIRKADEPQETILNEVVRMIQDPLYRRGCIRNHASAECEACKENGNICWRLDWYLDDFSPKTRFFPELLGQIAGSEELDIDVSSDWV